MHIAIRPPEYLPRLAFMALMSSVDVFVLADTFQYSRQSYQNRTWIRSPQGRHWLTIPLHGRQHGRPIRCTRIDDRTSWPAKHRRALQYNYSQTPFYAYVERQIESLLSSTGPYLGDITCASVSLLHRVYRMNCRLVRASELEQKPDSLQAILERFPDHRLVSPASSYTQDQRVVPDAERFVFDEPIYRQHFDAFEYDVSALDAFCNIGPDALDLLEAGRI